MKKVSLAILILVAIGLLAYADYYTNLPGGIPSPQLPAEVTPVGGTNPADIAVHPNITKDVLEKSGLESKYKIEKRTRSTELFESFDLSGQANIAVYRNILIDAAGTDQLPIYVYEIQGPAGQGSITYLNLKLAMIAQLGSEAGINETGDIGYNNLYFNDEANPSTGFLLVQVEDTVFGFKYSKNSSQAFDFIKSLVNNYMQSFSNSN